jgi:hypothetical protein
MRESIAAAAGFAAASMFPAAVISVTAPLGDELSTASTVASFAIAYPFSAVFTLLFGVPSFLILRRFGPGKWWWVLAVGFLLGIPVATAVRLPNRPDPSDMLVDGPLAAGAALVFWLIWKRSRNP